LRWIRRLGGPGDDLSYGVAPDNAGNLLLTGYFTGGPFTADGSLPLFTQPGNIRDIFVARLQNIITSTSSARLAADLYAWPNPTTNGLHLRLASRRPATATLLDALGRTLRTVPLTPDGPDQRAEVQLANQPTGLYLVRIDSEGASATVRVTKH
jgi:hypothetical protein